MGRIRTVKPEFFLHDDLYRLELETGLPVRIAYVGLWTQADREGRFKWKPLPLKAAILPYDNVDFEALLCALAEWGFVECYTDEHKLYGRIPSFHDHQSVNQREAESKLPDPAGCRKISELTRAGNARAGICAHVGKGKEGKGKEGVPTRRGREVVRPIPVIHF